MERGCSSSVGRGRSDGNPEAATAVVELLMMGMRVPKTCWAVFKRQVINMRNFHIWLVDSFESMMMHGLANPKKEKWHLLLCVTRPNFRNRFVKLILVKTCK